MTTTARITALLRSWPLMSRELRRDLIVIHPRTYFAMRRLVWRERRKS